ncbi:MAG: hypothetical protein JWM56_240 [Candidatus Peribacteria bacterium]|nr:hypothetical protein [Candidatus Peribacteria bacterium]
MHRTIKIRPFVFGFIVLAGIGIGIFFRLHPYVQKVLYDYPLVQQTTRAVQNITNTGTGSATTVDEFLQTPAGSSASSIAALPSSIRIQVPFATQAPTGRWSMPYAEACEEASLVLVHHFLAHKSISPAEMDKEILDLIKIENDDFGYSADIQIEQLSDVAKKKYGYDTELFYEFTIDDMKQLLAEGHPIIVPLAGRRIGNPYYSGQGPWYHMLVITGYDKKNFITNDVGTRHGEGYAYPYAKLFNNIHDWNMQNENIEQGKKVMMIVKQK